MGLQLSVVPSRSTIRYEGGSVTVALEDLMTGWIGPNEFTLVLNGEEVPFTSEFKSRTLDVTIDIRPEDHEVLANSRPDFLGINYYQTNTAAYNPEDGVSIGKMNTTGEKGSSEEAGVPGFFKRVQNPFVERTNWDWEIDPQGLKLGIKRITNRYDIPVMITENGLGEYDKLTEDKQIHDDYRIDYLSSHVDAIGEAIAEGSEVIGYCTWSFTDLLSWLNGYQKRYGFVYIDREEDDATAKLTRYKKDSYYWYQELIKKHS